MFILFLPHFLNSQIWLNQLMDESPPPQLHHKIEKKKKKEKQKTLSNKHTQKNLGGGEKLELKALIYLNWKFPILCSSRSCEICIL
jgi:hypothetical protein